MSKTSTTPASTACRFTKQLAPRSKIVEAKRYPIYLLQYQYNVLPSTASSQQFNKSTTTKEE